MKTRIDVVVLADNAATVPGLSTEHGLSMWLTAGGKNILFDTGQGISLPGNAAALGVDLRRTDAVVLSHGHYDHTGGLEHVFNLGISPATYMHPDAVGARYGCLQAPPHKPIGMPAAIAATLLDKPGDIMHTVTPTPIADGVWVTGPVPRRTPFEDTGGPLFLDESCLVKDPILDDQAIWMETADGIVVLLGCAHSGVVNTLDYISELAGATTLHAVIGGMHLLNASSERLEATARALDRHQVRLIAPCHCTGDVPAHFLAGRFPTRGIRAGAGSRFTWTSCG